MKSSESLSAVVRAARLRKKLSLRDIERVSDNAITGSYVSLIERGKQIPMPHKLFTLSKILDVSYFKLMKLAGHLDGGCK